MPPPSSEKRALRLLRPDPTQRPRLEEIRRNLEDRIIEAKREGWLGEVEGLQISLSGATDKLAQIDRRSRTATIDLGLPLLDRRTGRINKCDNAVQRR